MKKTLFKIFCLLCLLLVGNIAFSQTDTDEQLAAQYFQNKEFDKAVILYEKLFAKKPGPLFYNSYLDCLLELKDFNKAEKLVKKQIRQVNNPAKYQVDLGYVYLKSENQSKSKDQFESIIKELQPIPQQITDLANAFIDRGEIDYAIETYKKGRKLIKSGVYFNVPLAEIYEKKFDYQNMMIEFTDLLEYGDIPMETVQNLIQNTLTNDADNKKSDILKTILLKRVQKNPDNTMYSDMLMWISIQQKDFENALTQAKSLDKRLKQNGERVLNVARLSVSNRSFETAIKAYEYLVGKGPESYYYLVGKIELLNVKYQKIISSFNYTKQELTDLEVDYSKVINEFGKNSSTIPMIKNLSHLQAFYLNKPTDAINNLTEIIAKPNISLLTIAECKVELGDIYLMSGNQWEATLLYSQVEKANKNDTIGFTAKYRNAKLFYYIGEFDWSKAQLDVLKASTSKLIANDAMELSLLISDNMDEDSSYTALTVYSKADFFAFQNKFDSAFIKLDSIEKFYPASKLMDEVCFKKADIYILTGKYELADSMLQKIVTNYPSDILADDALFRLAELNEYQFKNKAKAQQLYQDLMTNYPGSLFVVEARKRFRNLRGDQIN
jgi:tetratricopeptide (TPR) repeat protein